MATSKDVIQTSEIWIGEPAAPLPIVAFIDYESAACATANEILTEVLQTYQGSVKINFRHFPLASKHQKAMKAAEAAVATAQENLFWPMHNLMFENRKKLGTISLQSYARQIGSTNKRLLDQLVNGVYAWQVREDLLEGLKKGVRDVPAIFIRENLFEGELTFSGLTREIELQLRRL